LKAGARKFPKSVNWRMNMERGLDHFQGYPSNDVRGSNRMTITIEIEGGAHDLYFGMNGRSRKNSVGRRYVEPSEPIAVLNKEEDD
jgi:hypothetical protein